MDNTNKELFKALKTLSQARKHINTFWGASDPHSHTIIHNLHISLNKQETEIIGELESRGCLAKLI